MRVVSWNLNGLLATLKNGSMTAVESLSPDILCLQEIRTNSEPTILPGYRHFWNHAVRRGYAGTAMLLKEDPIRVLSGFQDAFDDRDGRLLTAELSNCYVVNAYVPNSQKNLQRHSYRMQWDEAFREFVCTLDEDKPVIVCGDFNVARASIDIFEENMRLFWAEQGYASDERSNLETFLEAGFKDVFRELNPDVRSYTWWSNRLNKRDEDRGWRLDYFFVSERLMPKITSIEHLQSITGSDHCPIALEVTLT